MGALGDAIGNIPFSGDAVACLTNQPRRPGCIEVEEKPTPIEKPSLTTPRLLDSSTTLLTLLSNPLNVTLFTSQLLSAPSIWQRPDGLRTTIRILSIFNTAAIRLLQQEIQSPPADTIPFQPTLSKEEWAIAVIKGADERSPRWRHLCALAGLLIGFEGRGDHTVPRSLRHTLEASTVKAANLALEEGEAANELVANSIAMMLSHVFDFLSDREKPNLNHNLLLPVLYRASFFSKDGLHLGYFLSSMDEDVLQNPGMKFDWSPMSGTYVQFQQMARGPLLSSLGSLSRLTAFSIEQIQNIDLLVTMMKDLSSFTQSLQVQWRQNKLSEIDASEEQMYLGEETLRTTLPPLWRTLRSTMFAIVVILRSLLGRTLGDVRMPISSSRTKTRKSCTVRNTDFIPGPFMALQSLHTLRNLYFISSRMGSNTFSQYSFVYLTAIDILSQYPVQAEAFLMEVRSAKISTIPQHPLDRCHDLFFLNTAEHFALVLTPQTCDTLLIEAATTYLGLGSDARLLEIFEAAHSVMLAVLSAPHNTNLLVRHIHPYVDALFLAFPQTLSPRQFRMAIKTLVRVTSPPSYIAELEPLLPSTLPELVRSRLESASAALLPQDPSSHDQITLSEQAALELALIDALAFLPMDQLEEWLSLVAESLTCVEDPSQRQTCKQRLWDTLSNGEMDVNRAALCVEWWGTRGGRQMVLYGSSKEKEGPFMSGALVEDSKL